MSSWGLWGLHTAAQGGGWYHVTHQKLSPGDRITPGGGESFWTDDNAFSDRGNHVWLSDDDEHVGYWLAQFQRGKGMPHLYEVDPDQPPTPYDEDDSLAGHVTSGATVLRQHDPLDFMPWLGGTHTAAVEADVADDLMHLAGQDPYDTDDHRHTPRIDPRQFSYAPDGDRDTFSLYDDPEDPDTENPLSEMFVFPHGEIEHIQTRPDVRRQGYGTALLDWARQQRPDITHSDNQSEEGALWRAHEESRHRTAMPNPLPQGVHFRYHPELMWSPGVTAHQNGKMIGSLEWYHDDHIMVDLGTRKPGEIDRISVDPKHQGNSVASSMFDFAKRHEPRLHHSDRLTPDGEGWSAYEKSRHAAFNQDLVDRLHGEFHDWWKTAPEDPDDEREWQYYGDGGPLNSWAHIERFMADRYPAAHKNQFGGNDEARPNLLSEKRRNQVWGGPEDITQHGYDPAEIAAGMLVLHNRAHAKPPYNDEGDSFGDFDMGYLTRAFQKRQQMQRNYEQRQTTAAVTQNLVDRLHDEFKDWHRQQPKGSIFGGGMIGGLNEWPNIERFLKDRYPAAHRGLDMGYEEAGHVLLDGHSPMPYMVDSGMDTRPYETGPEAEATHGYDPKEIAAAMLLLHNKSDRFRGDMSQEDQARLNDIFDKRVKMQRTYEQRNARLAMAWDQWAPKIKSDNGGCGSGGCDYFEGVGTKWAGYFIDDDKNNTVGSLSFSHYTDENNKPQVGIRGIYTDKNHRNDGVAEALMRRLHEDHPGIPIDPGGMSSDGQAFHDRMLEKEPDARNVVTSSIVRRTAGRNGDLPEGLTFQHHPEGFEPFPDVIQPNIPVSNSYPTVSAHDGDRMIGHIQWRDDGHPRRNNEIWDLRVHPEYQRRGVATALFDWTTDQINPDLKHSNNLSDEGRAFAEAEDARPLAQERYEAWRNKQPMPKRFAGRNGPPPPMTFEPFNTMWSNGIMARHAEDGRPIAHLHWHPDGEIETIRVHPELQGRDIAKHVLAHAATHPETFEARQGIKPSNNLTNAGRAFARSLGHDPSDEEIVPADDDVTNWGWTAVDNYTPMHIPYTGQNEDEMSHHLDKPWTPPERTANTHGNDWPVWWRGRTHPDVPWDKRWHPNHPQHVPGPWDQ